MAVIISYDTDKELDIEYEKIIKEVINGALDYVDCPFECEVNVSITDNDGIAEINSEFRDIDRETDVLSFPALEFDEPGDFKTVEEEVEASPMLYVNPDTEELILGDIMVSVDKIKEQAEEYGHSEERELAFLIAHSMFHLFGYDHMIEEEAKVMEGKQRDLLEKLGITRD